jgi:hypothetical protein
VMRVGRVGLSRIADAAEDSLMIVHIADYSLTGLRKLDRSRWQDSAWYAQDRSIALPLVIVVASAVPLYHGLASASLT